MLKIHEKNLIEFPSQMESELINVLRVPLAIGIVLIHYPFPGQVGHFFSHEYLFRGIVALFFMISGYLFGGRIPSKISVNWYFDVMSKKSFPF